ncbi:MAG: RNA polymerase sigma factor [Candidatus Dojkabacteria bacterium]|nr:RNA polymerase sigma factor [Candidatus Dojkabacteria bacterium]
MKTLLQRAEFIDAFEKYNSQIFRYFYLRTNHHKETAQDLAQEVFTKVWRSRGSFDSEKAALKTWLFTISRNLLIDHYRKQKDEESLDSSNEEVIHQETSDEDKVVYKEILNQLKNLNDSEQELIILRFVEDFEIKEIADMLKKKYTATKIAILRALNKLKNQLNNEN